MDAPLPREDRPADRAWDAAAQAMRRAAEAVAHPGGPALFDDLVRALADTLDVATVFVAVFADDARSRLRSVAAVLDGRRMEPFDYPLAGSPCERVVGAGFRHVPRGVAAEFPPGALFAAEGMDAYAAYPMHDSAARPLGLLVAMNRAPIVDGALAEALLKIFAGRMAAELERGRAEEALQLAFTREITAQKLALEALRASEAQYREIFNASTDALILWDQHFRRVDVNPAYERIYGWARDEVVGRRYEHLPFGDDYAKPRAELVRRALAGEACSAELEALRKNGERILTEVHVIPFRHRGEPHVLAIARDITERKTAVAQLRASEEQHRAIFDSSADTMVLWNRELRIVDANRSFTRLTGFAREEVVGRAFDASPIRGGHVDERLALIRGAIEGREGEIETQSWRNDGSAFHIELRYVPVRFGGEPYALAIGRDITARLAAQAQRVELETQLRQAQKMEAIGQLTGGIAHDFNNILTSVIGYLVLGEERAEAIGDATLVRQLGQAHLAAQRARDLIAQMLAFARRQRGARRVLALAPLVRQSLGLLRATLPSSIVLDALDVDADVEEATPPVEADAVQLEQVLFNLCINARDAMAGSGRIRIGLHEAPGSGWRCASCGARAAPARWVELSVADSGSGVAPDVMARMFEPFYSTKAVGQGSGMGLAMVHGIVHEHGGHVRVDTQVGRGTTLRVMLPAAAGGAADAPSAPAASAGAPAEAAVAPRGCVLVVEDDAMVGDYLAERLQAWGWSVVLHRDPQAALAWLDADAARDVALLVTDHTMPRLTGLQLAERARVRRPALPVVLVSGNAEPFDPAALARCGVHAALAKPLDAARLRAAIADALASRRAGR